MDWPHEGGPAPGEESEANEQLPGQFASNTIACQRQPRRTALPELDRWSECERELAACQPLICHEEMRERLYCLNVKRFAGNVLEDPFDALGCEPVAFLPRGRFEFSKYCPIDPPRLCIIIPCRDPMARIVDIAAFDPDSCKVAIWRAAAPMLGAEKTSGAAVLSLKSL